MAFGVFLTIFHRTGPFQCDAVLSNLVDRSKRQRFTCLVNPFFFLFGAHSRPRPPKAKPQRRRCHGDHLPETLDVTPFSTFFFINLVIESWTEDSSEIHGEPSNSLFTLRCSIKCRKEAPLSTWSCHDQDLWIVTMRWLWGFNAHTHSRLSSYYDSSKV